MTEIWNRSLVPLTQFHVPTELESPNFAVFTYAFIMYHWRIVNTQMPQWLTQMPCKIIMKINQSKQKIYSCPYHGCIGINQRKKKLLTGSQRVWKKWFISSERDAGVFARNVFFLWRTTVYAPAQTLFHRAEVKLFSRGASGQGLIDQ